MTQVDEKYKCEKCNNIVKVVGQGTGALACCGAEMKCITKK